jgi:hypothetical protein
MGQVFQKARLRHPAMKGSDFLPSVGFRFHWNYAFCWIRKSVGAKGHPHGAFAPRR